MYEDTAKWLKEVKMDFDPKAQLGSLSIGEMPVSYTHLDVYKRQVLEKTTGILFVGQVYLNGLNYENLEIRFKDGMVRCV